MKKQPLKLLFKLTSYAFVFFALALPFFFVIHRSSAQEEGKLEVTVDKTLIKPNEVATITAKFNKSAKVTFSSDKTAGTFTPAQCNISAAGSFCPTSFKATEEGKYKITVRADPTAAGDYYYSTNTFSIEVAKNFNLETSISPATVEAGKATTITVSTSNKKSGIPITFDTPPEGTNFNGKTEAITCTTASNGSCQIAFASSKAGTFTLGYASVSPYSPGEISIKVTASQSSSSSSSTSTSTSASSSTQAAVSCTSGTAACTGGGTPGCSSGGQVICGNDGKPACTGGGVPACTGGGEGVVIGVKLKNPIKAETLQGFIKDLVNILLTIGIPLIALAFIWSGFLFVKAQGDEAGLKTAKSTFFYTVIGAAILLGAWVLAQAISGTIQQIGSGTGGGSSTAPTTISQPITTTTKILTAYATPAQIVGGQSATITALASDGKSGVTIGFTQPVGASVNPSSCQTGPSGSCITLFTPSVAGSYTINVSAFGYDPTSAQVQVSGPIIPTSSKKLELTTFPSTIGIGQSATINVSTSDEGEAIVTFSSNGGNLSKSFCQTVFGACSVNFSSFGSGTFNITASSSGYTFGSVTIKVQ